MLQHISQSSIRPERLTRAKGLASRVRGLWRSYWQRRTTRATIDRLSRIDDRMLKDIGIERSEIESVARSVACGWQGFHERGRR